MLQWIHSQGHTTGLPIADNINTQLPCEFLERIFQYCSPAEQARCARVCRCWNDLLYNTLYMAEHRQARHLAGRYCEEIRLATENGRSRYDSDIYCSSFSIETQFRHLKTREVVSCLFSFKGLWGRESRKSAESLMSLYHQQKAKELAVACKQLQIPYKKGSAPQTQHQYYLIALQDYIDKKKLRLLRTSRDISSVACLAVAYLEESFSYVDPQGKDIFNGDFANCNRALANLPAPPQLRGGAFYLRQLAPLKDYLKIELPRLPEADKQHLVETLTSILGTATTQEQRCALVSVIWSHSAPQWLHLFRLNRFMIAFLTIECGLEKAQVLQQLMQLFLKPFPRKWLFLCLEMIEMSALSVREKGHSTRCIDLFKDLLAMNVNSSMLFQLMYTDMKNGKLAGRYEGWRDFFTSMPQIIATYKSLGEKVAERDFRVLYKDSVSNTLATFLKSHVNFRLIKALETWLKGLLELANGEETELLQQLCSIEQLFTIEKLGSDCWEFVNELRALPLEERAGVIEEMVAIGKASDWEVEGPPLLKILLACRTEKENEQLLNNLHLLFCHFESRRLYPLAQNIDQLSIQQRLSFIHVLANHLEITTRITAFFMNYLLSILNLTPSINSPEACLRLISFLHKELPGDHQKEVFVELLRVLPPSTRTLYMPVVSLARNIDSEEERQALVHALMAFTPEEQTLVLQLMEKLINVIEFSYDKVLLLKALRGLPLEGSKCPISTLGSDKVFILKSIHGLPLKRCARLIDTLEGTFARLKLSDPLDIRPGLRETLTVKGVYKQPRLLFAIAAGRTDVFLAIGEGLSGIHCYTERMLVLEILSFMDAEQLTYSSIRSLQPLAETMVGIDKNNKEHIHRAIATLPKTKQIAILNAITPHLGVVPHEQKALFIRIAYFVAPEMIGAAVSHLLPLIVAGRENTHDANVTHLSFLLANQGLREEIHRYLEQLLESDLPAMDKLALAHLLFDNHERLYLHPEHPLVQVAIGAITLCTPQALQNPKNPYRIHATLMRTVATEEKSSFQPQPERIGSRPVCWQVDALQRHAELWRGYTVQDLPPDIDGTTLPTCFLELEERLKGLPLEERQTVDQYIQDSTSLCLKFLSDNLLQDRFINSLFNVGVQPDDPVSMSTFYLFAILKALLAVDNTPRVGWLSAREDMLVKMASSLQYCPTGRRDGISRLYNMLPFTERSNPSSSPSQDAHLRMAEEFVTYHRQSLLRETFDNEEWLATLLGIREISQLAHQILHLKNRYGKHFGLQHQLTFDMYTGVLYDKLLQLDTARVIHTFWNYCLPSQLVHKLIHHTAIAFREYDEKLQAYRQAAQAGTLDPKQRLPTNLYSGIRDIIALGGKNSLPETALFTWDEETFAPLQLTIEGGLAFLEALGDIS